MQCTNLKLFVFLDKYFEALWDAPTLQAKLKTYVSQILKVIYIHCTHITPH